ncbi:MAG: hypothetical protein KDJ65_17575 [Anaerolineae bacterium]|nr:hypothetical protein [Anaerolineae bacterium]
MAYLRGLIIALLIGLTIFFNLERLNFTQLNIINLASFVYILGVSAVISIISMPILRRASVTASLVIWLGIYIFCKIFLFNDRPILGGLYTYLTVTELVLLTVLILLAHKVADTLNDFEEVIANISLSQVDGRVQQFQEAKDIVDGEMLRSRRFHRPLSVVVVRPEADSINTTLHRIVQEVQQAMMERYVFTSLAHVISDCIERTNFVLAHSENNRFILLCPETNINDTTGLVEHIRNVATEKLGVSVACGVSSFPDQALTFEELVNHAEKNIKYSNHVAKPSVSPVDARNGHHQSL